MKIDKKVIRSLAKLLEEENLSEVDIGQGESYIKIARNTSPLPQVAISPNIAASTGTSEKESEKTVENGEVIKSPMVGVAYLTPEPDAPPYIAEGKTVKKGDTLLIIEAMKTMNYVKSPRDGTVVKIIAKHGEPVEFDQPLLVIS